MANRATISKQVGFTGRGVHTGARVRVLCQPTQAGKGIVMARTNLPNRADAKLSPHLADGKASCTRVRKGDLSIMGIEHLLAAAWALGITDLRVEVNGPEMPIGDGSARNIFSLLKSAGISRFRRRQRIIKVKSPIWVAKGSSWVAALPGPDFRITCYLTFREDRLPPQLFHSENPQAEFAQSLADARTFGYPEDLAQYQAQGLAKATTTRNTLGIAPHGYLSKPRYSDEPVRHKALDLLGDLALLDAEPKAHIIACNAGHTLHLELAKRLVRS